MKSSAELKKDILAIDHRGYPGYKGLRGRYQFKDHVLSIDHVQGDPFASPSHLSVHVDGHKAGFPKDYYQDDISRITLQDHLTRCFGKALAPFSFKAKGSGKSGLLSVSHCGQQVLERTACEVSADGSVTVRFEAGFPANGRSVNAGELVKMLFQFVPEAAQIALFYDRLNKNALKAAIELARDQQFIREHLSEQGLAAFLADGSVLPRESGISDRPMKGAVPFQSPAACKVTVTLPYHGPVTGMGIKKGITLFVGGGYHGKSTILQALEMGVYNHIAGDGREYVITDPSAWKLRAEDGRSISNTDISPFINHLPNKKDTVHFSTEDASGSTSQAANLMEAVESGSKLLLIDEDTSATNFMIRDELMQKVICREEEPITPFIERVRSMYDDLGVSSIIVAGSSGSFFGIADTIIQMKEYVPYDITERAREAAASYPALKQQEHFPVSDNMRAPKANQALKKDPRLKMKTMGTNEMLLAKDAIELRYLEQLIDPEQTNALAYALKYLELNRMNGSRTVPQLLDDVEALTASKGLSALYDKEYVRSGLAMPRRQEIAACLNRYRKLYFN
ncbi:MAG TPA: isopentenyl-diphosphate delta-isomerase [Lachnospiraceae bacterium]|nr:isopentenyl-diphosphate delta-isomerase [Lachnospiraceae bacterium]